MACSAGGPMEITIPDVDEDDKKCNDCGKRFKRQKRKARCPECGSENLSSLQAVQHPLFFVSLVGDSARFY
jgi:Zn finger protein HypA/HybF involved in hydrogenase expression